jgi:hypothetical protein
MKLPVPGEELEAMLAVLVRAKRMQWDSFHAGG